ncbi:MAG: flavin monoamine oxidase family protein [Gammaproteobacteria bacterium]
MNNTIDRRTLLKAMSATPILASAPGILRAQNKSDVIVIGAGLSGLNAALLLEGEGLSVSVLEGRNRIGGRVSSLRDIPGSPEVGGTAFGPGYARLVDAAMTHGVDLIDITPIIPFFFARELFLDGKAISRTDWPTHPRNPFPEGARETMPWEYMRGFMAQNNPLKTTDAWRDPANAHFDISMYDWLKGKGQSDATIDMAYNMDPPFGTSAYDISALHPMASAAFGAMQFQLVAGMDTKGYTAKNGNQSIPEAMANALQGDVLLNHTVSGIRSNEDGAEVHCADGKVFRADRVICSIPCSVLRRIRIDPLLEGLQARGVQTLDSQSINQVHMVAKSPYWEKDGLNPNMITDGLAGMVVAEHKGAAPADITSLTAWIRGPGAIWMDQNDTDKAIAAVIADIERQRPAAKGQLEVVGYKSWYRDLYSSGDWAYWQPGQVTEFATALGLQHHRLHFCGEHTAVSNRGMEGAMESGERAALEVLNIALA